MIRETKVGKAVQKAKVLSSPDSTIICTHYNIHHGFYVNIGLISLPEDLRRVNLLIWSSSETWKMAAIVVDKLQSLDSKKTSGGSMLATTKIQRTLFEILLGLLWEILRADKQYFLLFFLSLSLYWFLKQGQFYIFPKLLELHSYVFTALLYQLKCSNQWGKKKSWHQKTLWELGFPNIS